MSATFESNLLVGGQCEGLIGLGDQPSVGYGRVPPMRPACWPRGGQILVYPGGDLEAYRHSRLRDQIVLGERTGFVRVAQQAGVPIVPIVAHGAHRSAYIFTDGAAIARLMELPRCGRLERFPLALAMPWGLAIGPWIPYLPLPFPIRLRVLAPILVGPEDNPAVVREAIRVQMQTALDDLARDASR